jgi:hypothetical protein
MQGDPRKWLRLAVRTDEGASAVAEVLRRRRRITHSRVWSPAAGWVIVVSSADGRQFSDGSMDLSRRMGVAVFQLGSAESPAFSAISLGNVVYADQGSACKDTDMLVTWLAPDRPLANLQGRGPADLAQLLNVPAPTEFPPDAPTVECPPKRWWEFWV